MGLMDNIAGAAGGLFGGQGGEHSGIVNALLQMISSNKFGGLSGLLDSFTKNGLGQHVSSWVGKGENMPVTDEQVKQGFGSDRIQEIANQTGEPHEKVTSGLTKVLPTVIDKLTPEGLVPEGSILEKGISFLKGKL